MQKEKIVQAMVDYIERTYKEKRERYQTDDVEISLFEWGHALRCKINNEYGIFGDKNRVLVAEAYNRTHPHRFYQIPYFTMDRGNEGLNFQNLKL